MNKEVRYNEKLHAYESVDVCPHSDMRTCNGGWNSCLACPKGNTPKHRTINFLIGLAIAIVFLLLCTSSTVDSGPSTVNSFHHESRNATSRN